MRNEAAKQLVAEWLDTWKPPQLVRRELPRVDWNALSEILCVAGPRRAGKTFYLFQLIGDLLELGVPRERILFVDFEDYRFLELEPASMDRLLETFEQFTGAAPDYLFLDEVQHLPAWNRVLRTLHNRRRFRIVISGSNSQLLGRELATELRGRTRDWLILPFSFREFLHARGLPWTKRTLHTRGRGRVRGACEEYLHDGGFPEVLHKQTLPEKRSLLRNYFETVFYRDILERYNVRVRHLLEMLMRCTLEEFGTRFSISAFRKRLEQAGLPGSKRTIANYLAYLSEAFLVLTIEKFAHSPRIRMANPRQLYLIDSGFHLLSGGFPDNRGRILENAVAVELYRRGRTFRYFKEKRECDFLLVEGRRAREALQVCWELTPRNRDREVLGLVEAMKAHDLADGTIVTFDGTDEFEAGGRTVRVLPAWRWFLE